MAGGKRQGPLQAHMALPTLEESDAPHTIEKASKHVVDDEGIQTNISASVCRSNTTRDVCRNTHLGEGH
eukprot:12912103-Prorocentrum_lima.AAC.1